MTNERPWVLLTNKRLVSDLEDRVDDPDGAAGLVTAHGVVRGVLRARALEIFLS